MRVLAAILDPSDNGFDIGDLSVLLGVILLISGTTATIVRWNAKRVAEVRTRERTEMEQRIKAAVEDVAVKLQPKNGGIGWSDTAATVKQIAARQGEVLESVTYLRERLDSHIDWHVNKEN